MRRECRERFPRHRLQRKPLVSHHAPRHVLDARGVMHVGIAKPRRRGKRSQHSRRMRNPHFYVSGKRSMGGITPYPGNHIYHVKRAIIPWPGLYPTMPNFVTEMCMHVHISVTKWYIVGYFSNALCDLCDASIMIYSPRYIAVTVYFLYKFYVAVIVMSCLIILHCCNVCFVFAQTCLHTR